MAAPWSLDATASGNHFEQVATDPRGSLLGEGGVANLPTPYGVRVQRPAQAAALDFVERGYDADLGTVRFGARDYDPELGQFWSPDPLFLTDIEKCAQSPFECNLYGYARGNPLSWTDPTGLDVWDWVADGVEAFGTIAGGAIGAAAGLGIGSAAGGLLGAGLGRAAMSPIADMIRDEEPSLQRQFRAGVNGMADHTMGLVYAQAFKSLARMAVAQQATIAAVRAESRAVAPGLTSLIQQEARALSSSQSRPASGMCFGAGTQVLLANGTTKAIEDVEVGDIVLADDPSDTRGPMTAEVSALIRSTTGRVIHVVVDDGDGVSDGTFEATGRHPFWTENEGWIQADQLQAGDRLLNAGGNVVHVVEVWSEQRETETFNLSIDRLHTYFVVANGISALVHNEDPSKIKYAQDSIGPNFGDSKDVPERWRGRPVSEAIDEARKPGRLPEGLRLNVMEVNEELVALNSRTLYVARKAGLSNVKVNNVGHSGVNQYNRMLKDSRLSGPVNDVRLRCN